MYYVNIYMSVHIDIYSEYVRVGSLIYNIRIHKNECDTSLYIVIINIITITIINSIFPIIIVVVVMIIDAIKNPVIKI